jgi:hypothetical protein
MQAINDAWQNLGVLKKELSTSPLDRYYSHAELGGNLPRVRIAGSALCSGHRWRLSIVGLQREERLAKKIDDVTAAELQQAVPATSEQYVQQGHLQGEYSLLSKDGRRVAILYEALVFPDGCMTARWHPLKK